MGPDVYFQVSSLWKANATDVAFIWLFTSMCPHVYFQVSSLWKSNTTEWCCIYMAFHQYVPSCVFSGFHSVKSQHHRCCIYMDFHQYGSSCVFSGSCSRNIRRYESWCVFPTVPFVKSQHYKCCIYMAFHSYMSSYANSDFQQWTNQHCRHTGHVCKGRSQCEI